MDAVLAAYLLVDDHNPHRGGAFGRCGRCARSEPLAPTHTVVSRTFTATDDWADPGGAGLCPACTWLYSTPALRFRPHRLSRSAFAACTPQQLLTELSAGPIDPSVAISVPLRPGRKHVCAGLAWGTIRTDNLNLTWSRSDAHLLAVVDELRRTGFGPRMLTEPSPPWPQLRRLPATQWNDLIASWRSLDPWRLHARPHLELATALTRRPAIEVDAQ